MFDGLLSRKYNYFVLKYVFLLKKKRCSETKKLDKQSHCNISDSTVECAQGQTEGEGAGMHVAKQKV